VPHGNLATLCHQLKAAPDTAGIPVIHVSTTERQGSSGPVQCSADVCLSSEVKARTLVGTLKSVVLARAIAQDTESRARSAVAGQTLNRYVDAVGKLDEMLAVSSGSTPLCLEPQLGHMRASALRENRYPDTRKGSLTSGTSSVFPIPAHADAILSAVLENTSEAMFISDTAGMILATSKSTVAIFGDIVNDCKGRAVALLDSCDVYGSDGHTPAAGAFARLVRLACQGHDTRDLQMFVRSPVNGFWVSCDAVPLPVAGSRACGCLLTIRDITPRKRADDVLAAGQRELEERTTKLTLSNEKLSRANRELQHFTSVVAHDVKSPLSTVSTLTTWLWEEFADRMDSEGRSYVACVQKAIQRMNRLVNAAHEYARLASSQKPPVAQADAAETLAWVMASLEPEIRATRGAVTSSPLPAVYMNGKDLEQVFQHLISNGLKYGRSDVPPRVHVAAARTGDEWVFSVTDNGAGIDAKDSERLFEPLGRIYTSDGSGAGLGLAICRKIIELHGGRIWLASTGRDGSTFCFSIPDEPDRIDPPAASRD
jgi:signal transduction histidine kinase